MWAMTHSVRAAARTKRNVLAPTMRCRLRHWSCPSPAKALLSRIVISTAQRWPYSRTISSALKVRSVVKKASRAGGALAPLFGAGLALTAQHHNPHEAPRQHRVPQPLPGLDLGTILTGVRSPTRGGLCEALGRADQVALFGGGHRGAWGAVGVGPHRAWR